MGVAELGAPGLNGDFFTPAHDIVTDDMDKKQPVNSCDERKEEIEGSLRRGRGVTGNATISWVMSVWQLKGGHPVKFLWIIGVDCADWANGRCCHVQHLTALTTS